MTHSMIVDLSKKIDSLSEDNNLLRKEVLDKYGALKKDMEDCIPNHRLTSRNIENIATSIEALQNMTLQCIQTTGTQELAQKLDENLETLDKLLKGKVFKHYFFMF